MPGTGGKNLMAKRVKTQVAAARDTPPLGFASTHSSKPCFHQRRIAAHETLAFGDNSV
jgi:hypothetical protein